MRIERRWIAAIAVAIAVVVGVRTASASGLVKNVKVVRIGAVDLSPVSIHASGASASRPLARTFSPARAVALTHAVNRRLASLYAIPAATQTLIPPAPVASSLTLASGNLVGYTNFPGLNALDSNIANPAAPLGIEPPDQGLCAGHGTVVEIVNLVFATYDMSGNPQSSAMNLNTLFGVAPTDFLSDPRCYYDAPSQTFFFTVTDLGDSDPVNDIWSPTSSLLIGVMPAGGTAVNVFQVNSTDSDNPDGLCPCFADQPLLGADKYGLYISGNEFPLSSLPFTNGAEIFTIKKSDLVNGTAISGVVFWPSTFAFSIQPAAPTQGQFDTSNNGTEYLMSSLDFSGTRDNRIELWAITNTCAIPGSSACSGLAPQLSDPTVIATPTYGLPRRAQQMRGMFPVGQSVRNPFETLDTGDDRMQQVVYADGNLYAGLNTVLKVGRRLHTGILYFIIQPSVSAGVPIVNSISGNYAALAGADLYYPSIAANANGSAVMTFSISGPRHFPSAAYMPLTGDLGPPAIYIGQPGAAPYDGISGYRKYGGLPPARWGDYSAAFADDNGNLWMASEYAGPSCSKRNWAADHTCNGTRGEYANWATNIGEITAP
jgi:hypothetical protein